MTWALENRREAFDRLLPVASEESRAADTQIAISLRQEGFEDHFEFLLRLDCLRSGGARAVLSLPEGEPLAVQLARARLAEPEIGLEKALSLVRLKHITLPEDRAKRLLRDFLSATIPARPQTGIYLHRPMYEVTIFGWSELHLVLVDDADRKSGFAPLLRAIHAAMTAAHLKKTDLRFDPQAGYYPAEEE